MGFSSQGWLTAFPEKRQPHSLMPADVKGSVPEADDFTVDNYLVFQIDFHRAGGDRMELLLSRTEVSQMLPLLYDRADDATKLEEGIKVLAGLRDSEFLKALTAIIKRRETKP